MRTANAHISLRIHQNKIKTTYFLLLQLEIKDRENPLMSSCKLRSHRIPNTFRCPSLFAPWTACHRRGKPTMDLPLSCPTAGIAPWTAHRRRASQPWTACPPVAPPGASCHGISYRHPGHIHPGGKINQAVQLAPQTLRTNWTFDANISVWLK